MAHYHEPRRHAGNSENEKKWETENARITKVHIFTFRRQIRHLRHKKHSTIHGKSTGALWKHTGRVQQHLLFRSPIFPRNCICDLPVISLLLVRSVSREQLLLQRVWSFGSIDVVTLSRRPFSSHSRVSGLVMHVCLAQFCLVTEQTQWELQNLSIMTNTHRSSPWQRISL